MNIRSAQQRPFVNPSSNATAGPAAAQPRRAQSPGDASASATRGAESGSADGTRGRLEAAGAGFSERLQSLLESGDLSREEAAALAEAGAEFEALMERMDNALAEGGIEQDGKLARAFDFALDSLRQDVRNALSGGGESDSSDPVGGADKAPQLDTRKGGDEARLTSGSEEADPAAVAARLSAAFDTLNDRLANLAQQRGGEGGSEIKALQARFGEVFDRLENAVAGGMNTDALGDLFQRMMGALRDGVRGGGDSGGPLLYDAKSGITPLGGPKGSSGLDALA